jgi:hypothetical protein
MPRRGACLTLLLGLLAFCVSAAEPTAAERAAAWLGDVRLPPRNYVANGSFEDGLKGWQYFVHQAGGVDPDRPFAEAAAFRLDGLDENRHVYLYQYRIPLETGKTYTLSAALRTEGLSQANCDFGVLFLINYGWTQAAVLKPAAPTTDWTVLKATFTAFPTKPRPDGKPDYSLVAYWPPKSAGKVWIDTVQLEEGDQATAFTDVDLRPGLEALDRLPALATRLFAAQEALAKFPAAPLIASLKQDVSSLQGEAEGIKADLLKYATSSKETRAGLAARLDAADAALAAAQTLVWTGPAHIPLSEVALPAARPKEVSIDLTCVQGEHRDIAINVANFTPTGFEARLEISELYNEALALSVLPHEWLRGYSVPRIRGFARPNQLFTDPLPELGNAGIFHAEPADVSQVLISIDTAPLRPGGYAAVLTVSSLTDRACRQSIPVTLNVLPFRLPELAGVDITDCYGYASYALPAMQELGLNTYTLSTSWMDVEFDDDGSLKRWDFTRLGAEVEEYFGFDNVTQFLLLNLQGMYRFLETRYGWKPAEPRFERAIKAWVASIAAEMQKRLVPPANVIIETFDEPGPGDLPTAMQMARWVKEAAPAMQTMFYASGVSQDPAWAEAAKAHDIIAPIMAQCTPKNLAFLKSLGRRLWVYDCQANGETFHPLAYYRLMPWMCWQYGISGWAHFHWFNTPHDRPDRAWDGVEAQNLVYPGQPGTDPVLSRRYLAIRAGHEDYRALKALEKAVARAAPDKAEAAARAQAFLASAGQRALELSPRQPRYETHIAAGLPPDRIDRMREDSVALLQALEGVLPEIPASLRVDDKVEPGVVLSIDAPGAGYLFYRYLTAGYGHGWGRHWANWEQEASPEFVNPGPVSFPLTVLWRDTYRWLVDVRSEDGRIWLGSPTIIPRIAVDSTAPSYSKRPLNDGVRLESVKFEPEYAWISGGEAVEHWVEMDLGKPRQVAEVGLWWMTFTGLPKQTMLTYLDGTEWKPVSATPTWRPAASAVEKLTFTPVTTTKLRLLQAAGGGGPGGPNLMGLSEIEVR